MTQMIVSFEDCRRELMVRGGAPAVNAYDEWRHRKGYAQVVDFVLRFTHRYLFEITPAQVTTVKEESKHALGDIRKEEQLQEVEDFTCPFAFQHLFHLFIEEKQCLPTWQQIFPWLYKEAAPFWLHPLLRRLDWKSADQHRRTEIWRAVQWRLGKFYYSAFREVELLTRLRCEFGLPVRYHLLADVLLRVDFWMDNTLVCTYFPNPRYRTGCIGRKPPAAAFFHDARPPFEIVDIEITRQGFGNFWTVSNESISSIATRLSKGKGRP